MITTLVGLVGVLVVLFVAAAALTRGGGELADAPPDRADLVLPEGPMTAADVAAVRLPTAVRGYRMREVDEVLARLAAELAERDERLARLEGGVGSVAPAGPAAEAPTDSGA